MQKYIGPTLAVIFSLCLGWGIGTVFMHFLMKIW
jgi:hypothetical protein